MGAAKERWLAILLFCIIFTIIYGGVAALPHYTELDGRTPIDDAIPFIPMFILLYFMADIIVIVPLLLIRQDKIARYTAALIIMLCVAALFFIALPIRMEKTVTYDGSIWSTLTAVQHRYDSEFNNFPSLHVAFTMLATLALWREDRKWGYAALPLAFGIIASVVLVKQHLFIDIIGGILLATGVFYWYTRTAPSRIEQVVHDIIAKA